jgi:lipopolysaccharide transport system permease protein
MTANRTVAVPPLRVIVPRTGRAAIDWRELWAYRELLGFLVWRDVKVRYKQTVLGAAWAVLQPVMTMIVFTVLFGRWAKVPSDGHPYALFAFAALVPWTFFANALGTVSGSLVGNTHLISKVYFPRLLIALSALGAGLVDMAIALLVLLAMMAGFGVAPTWRVVAVPGLALLMLLTAAGVGSGLAALCGLYRDVRYVVPFMTQLWMFASPVIYPLSIVPARWRPLLYLNPMAGVIDGFRSALLGGPFNPPAIAVSAVMSVAAVWAGFSYFRRVERVVADVI